MQTTVGHMQFNVQPANLAFYRGLMAALGWTPIYEADEMLGVLDAHGTSLWFAAQVKAGVAYDYDGPGLNHLAFAAQSQADVDTIAAYLAERGVAHLFETPRHRPEFAQDPAQTYYQVMFETPDRILVEVVYTGPKAA